VATDLEVEINGNCVDIYLLLLDEGQSGLRLFCCFYNDRIKQPVSPTVKHDSVLMWSCQSVCDLVAEHKLRDMF
jgi:hypothetical protein